MLVLRPSVRPHDDIADAAPVLPAGRPHAGAGAGVAADVVVNPGSPTATPGFGLFLAGLGIGVMAASSLRD